MLDSLKKLNELRELLAKAKQEREETVRVLADLASKKTDMAQVDRSLETTREDTRVLIEQVQGLTGRVEGLLARITDLESVDARVNRLTDTLAEAEQTAQQLLGPEGQIAQYRALVQQVSAQEVQTRTTLEALKRDQQGFEELRDQLQQASGEVKDATDRFSGLKTEFEQLRSLGSQLTQDYGKFRDTSREARDHANITMETAKDIEKKLASFTALEDLSRTTKERLSALNQLAEHVSQKTKTLETQKQTIEHAIVESSRLNEMVWSMDAQVTKLNEGLKFVASAEETAERLERLARETTAQVDAAMKAKDAFQQDLARMDRDRGVLTDFIRSYDERLALERKELDSFDQRIRTIQTGIADVERSVENVTAKDHALAAMAQQFTTMEVLASSLAGQVDEVQRRQTQFDGLRERLDEVDDLSTRTRVQFENLNQLRETLETLRADIIEFYKAHQAAAQLVERLDADRTALGRFVDRFEGFRANVPELESKMDTITSRLTIIDEGVHRASNLVVLADELDRQMTRVANTYKFVEKVEQRVNALYALAGDVDTKLADQLNRRAEIDSLKSICDNVGVQVTDVQQKLEAVAAVQKALVPLRLEISAIKSQIEKAHARFKEAQKEDAVLAEQERRLTELLTANRDASTEVAASLTQVQGLTEELRRATQTKDELIEELTRVQVRQRDVAAQATASDYQSRRLEGVLRQLEQRRSQLAFMERTISGFEEKLNAVKQLSEDLDRTIEAVGGRIAVVDAVRREVEGVHEVSAKCRADLMQLTEQRTALSAMKERVDALLATTSQTNEQINQIAIRRAQVEDVYSKTTSVVNLLEDVRLNLELVSEQKAVVEHVAQDLAGLGGLVTDGQRTLRALKAERELAERIERSIKTLRAKGGNAEEDKRLA
ncbi:MAG: hypothetical protein NT151_08035 [Acidobacteria bacterium]|nr:hypothetical protein [Acidobacteriota bacterium]